MIAIQRLLALSSLSLSLVAFRAQAQEEPTIDIIPDPAADQAEAVTQDISLPEEAAEGLATAEENRAAANASENAADAAEAAAEGLAEAQANAADAAEEGLATAMDAVSGAREEMGRANVPEGLPDQVPEDLPAVPEDTPPEDAPADLPDVPDVPTPAGG